MHYLMACAPQVEGPRIPLFRKLYVSCQCLDIKESYGTREAITLDAYATAPAVLKSKVIPIQCRAMRSR